MASESNVIADAIEHSERAMLECQLCGDFGDARGVSGVRIVSVKRLALKCVCLRCGKAAVAERPATDADRKRARRNRQRRERYDAMRSLGLVKTPYGWE